MNRPSFITEAGDRLELEWQRLKPAAEVETQVPDQGAMQLAKAEAAGWSLVATVVDGDGFDRRTVRVIQTDSLDSVAPNSRLRSELDPDRKRLIRSILTEGEWRAADMPFVERAARRILADHDYPLDTDYPGHPLWRWFGEDYCWAVLPPHVTGHLEGELLTMRQSVHWGEDLLGDQSGKIIRKGTDGLAVKLWPEGSAFRWAHAVYTCTHGYRLALAAADDDQERRFDIVSAFAFELGAFLADDTFRRLYSADLRRGQSAPPLRVKDQGRVDGGKTAGKQKKDRAKEKWVDRGLALAILWRTQNPTIIQADVVRKLLASDLPTPQERAVQKQVKTWEDDPSSGLLPALKDGDEPQKQGSSVP